MHNIGKINRFVNGIKQSIYNKILLNKIDKQDNIGIV